MTKENEQATCCSGEKKNMGGAGASGAVYGMGLIGSLVYFIQHADTFWIGVLGVLKALVWPAILIYKAFEVLYK